MYIKFIGKTREKRTLEKLRNRRANIEERKRGNRGHYRTVVKKVQNNL